MTTWEFQWQEQLATNWGLGTQHNLDGAEGLIQVDVVEVLYPRLTEPQPEWKRQKMIVKVEDFNVPGTYYLAKIYYGAESHRHYQREATFIVGSEFIMDVLYTGTTAEHEYATLSAYITGEKLTTYWSLAKRQASEQADELLLIFFQCLL